MKQAIERERILNVMAFCFFVSSLPKKRLFNCFYLNLISFLLSFGVVSFVVDEVTIMKMSNNQSQKKLLSWLSLSLNLFLMWWLDEQNDFNAPMKKLHKINTKLIQNWIKQSTWKKPKNNVTGTHKIWSQVNNRTAEKLGS